MKYLLVGTTIFLLSIVGVAGCSDSDDGNGANNGPASSLGVYDGSIDIAYDSEDSFRCENERWVGSVPESDRLDGVRLFALGLRSGDVTDLGDMETGENGGWMLDADAAELGLHCDRTDELLVFVPVGGGNYGRFGVVSFQDDVFISVWSDVVGSDIDMDVTTAEGVARVEVVFFDLNRWDQTPVVARREMPSDSGRMWTDGFDGFGPGFVAGFIAYDADDQPLGSTGL